MAGFTEASWKGSLDSKGRATVPAEIRERLGLEPGDSVLLTVSSVKAFSREVSSVEEAKAFVDQFSDVESFSFDGELVEVVVCD